MNDDVKSVVFSPDGDKLYSHGGELGVLGPSLVPLESGHYFFNLSVLNFPIWFYITNQFASIDANSLNYFVIKIVS